eukprot:Opistho-1_new@28873
MASTGNLTQRNSDVDGSVEEQPLPPTEASNYGCAHYRRACLLKAVCCGEYFACRHCHNEKKDHELDRYKVEQIKCAKCGHEQKVHEACEACGIHFARYFCATCRFFDDDISKKQFHCDACGLCRVGGRDNFFHCERCDMCYHIQLKDNHKCVEKAMHANCAICLEFLFTSREPSIILPCGHPLHLACRQSYVVAGKYSCPVCRKSMCDMSEHWREFDEAVAQTPMPPEYASVKAGIKCNDCLSESVIPFHVLGLKCTACGSYNTTRTSLIGFVPGMTPLQPAQGEGGAPAGEGGAAQ